MDWRLRANHGASQSIAHASNLLCHPPERILVNFDCRRNNHLERGRISARFFRHVPDVIEHRSEPLSGIPARSLPFAY